MIDLQNSGIKSARQTNMQPSVQNINKPDQTAPLPQIGLEKLEPGDLKKNTQNNVPNKNKIDIFA